MQGHSPRILSHHTFSRGLNVWISVNISLATFRKNIAQQKTCFRCPSVISKWNDPRIRRPRIKRRHRHSSDHGRSGKPIYSGIIWQIISRKTSSPRLCKYSLGLSPSRKITNDSCSLPIEIKFSIRLAKAWITSTATRWPPHSQKEIFQRTATV